MVPTTTTNNGIEIPLLGFGVFQIPSSRTVDAVRHALDAGYRHIDTAQVYGNEIAVGEAVAKSGVGRDEVFITTKLNPFRHGSDSTIREFDASLRRLGTSYVDLFLLHWPYPDRPDYLASWQACEQLLADGRARAIGVSNLTVTDLEWLAENTGTVPAVNQVEVHPNFQQVRLRQYHDLHGILTQAWGPLAMGHALQDPNLQAIAARYGKTTAQLILRWHLQVGTIPIPKSVQPTRIAENIDISDFRIDPEDMLRIAALDGVHGGAPSRSEQNGLPRW